jgi:RNA polymerase sigma-70 factor (ECF subfamily)
VWQPSRLRIPALKRLDFITVYGILNRVADVDFEQLVQAHYASLFRFALSLARDETAAADLVQQTFFLWASKGDSLRVACAARSWLLTTLHREFLGGRRRDIRFTQVEVNEAEADEELPHIGSEAAERLDGRAVMQALMEVPEIYRAPLALFYLEDMSYQEIAETLEVPAGTVMSRLARGKDQLRQLLRVDEDERRQKFMSLRVGSPERVHG